MCAWDVQRGEFLREGRGGQRGGGVEWALGSSRHASPLGITMFCFFSWTRGFRLHLGIYIGRREVLHEVGAQGGRLRKLEHRHGDVTRLVILVFGSSDWS